ncbi:MAG TPA: molecular chaperone Hsp20 [Acetobacteraceae bacterium]|jgi:HSP20 family protein|nr:molecular chaperone Hsp20 [Acetobacteraceae bacterium]
MANAPVPVKQSVAPSSASPDIWRSLRTEMDRLFDTFTGRFGMTPMFSPRFDTTFAVPSPAVDITENEAAFTLTAEVPGMTDKEVQVSLSGDTLMITGEKRQEREEKNENRYLAERSYGSFQRSFVLPDSVDPEKVAASFANGVLSVTLPKVAKAATKKIEVKAAA